VVVGDLEEHLVQVAGFLADVHHVDHDGVADLGGPQWIGHGFAFANRVMNLDQGAGIDFVAAGFLGDVDGVENRYAGGNQRAQGSREAGDDRLGDDAAEDGDLELDNVHRIFAALA